MFGYSVGSDPDQFEAIRGDAILFLRFVAAFAVFNAMAMMFTAAIKGAGDTHFILRTSFIMSVALVAACWSAVQVFDQGILTLWCILTVWVAAFGVIYLIRFLGGNWKSMQVIEDESEWNSIDEAGSVAALEQAEL